LDLLTTYFQSQIKLGRLKSENSADDLALSLIGMVFVFTVTGPQHYGIKPQPTALHEQASYQHLSQQVAT